MILSAGGAESIILSACAESMILSAPPWMLVAQLKRLEGLRRGLHQPPLPLFPLQVLVDCCFFCRCRCHHRHCCHSVVVTAVTVAAVTITIAVAIAVLTAVLVAATNISCCPLTAQNPLVVLCKLVVALPLVALPSCPLLVPPSCPLVILSLRRPLVVSSHRLVTALPLVAPPSCCPLTLSLLSSCAG